MPDRAGLSTARLFLAVWPGDAVRDCLAEAGRRLHRDLGGRLSRPETLHLTLVFIGALARERIDALQQTLASIRAERFDMTFDRAGCWRHNRIAQLTPSDPPAMLFELVRQIETRLDQAGFTYDRRAYRPHVTLIRKAECENPARGRVSGSPEPGEIGPIIWSAGSFVLVESVPTPSGVRYDVIERYALL